MCEFFHSRRQELAPLRAAPAAAHQADGAGRHRRESLTRSDDQHPRPQYPCPLRYRRLYPVPPLS